MINVLLYTTYALAAAGLALAMRWLGPVEPTLAALAGALLFLWLVQVHGGIARTRRRRSLRREIGTLRMANAKIKGQLDETRKKMAEVTMALAKRSDAQEKKVVGELQMIEGLIREFAASLARRSKDEPGGQDEVPQMATGDGYATALADPDMLETIRRSLEENRVDLYLQPMVSLPQRKVRFYEALSRLRSEDGVVIMPAQYIRIAAPAGLMSVVDNLLLFRCVQVVRRLTHKRRDVGVFCNISGHTLTDAEFFPQFLDFMHHHRDLAGQIVFEFTQESVTQAGPQEEANLRYLAGLGFSLSMDQVQTLDLDFARLKALGISYLKVPADTLMSGMRSAHAQVAAEDFKDLLARNGVNLIVERIEDEKTVVQLLEYNVDFGQGYLFGEPRPIREMSEAHDTRAPVPANLAFLSDGLARRLAG